jgi:nitrogen regulatory protein P-II 1
VKLITAVVQPSVFEAIKDALGLFGVRGMTVEHIHHISQDSGHIEIYRGKRFSIDSQPKVKIELLAANDEVSDLTRVISNIMGRDGPDANVWISHIDLVARVRTGEYGLDAL